MMNHAELELTYSAPTHKPFPIVLSKGDGVYVWDSTGKKYLDMASAVSVVNFGHTNPRLIKALVDQAQTLSMTSRLFHHEKLGIFLQKACEMTGQAQAIPMNSGAEAVETAIKAARKWGYIHKNIPDDKAEIIICDGNFHGRTISLISLSSEPKYKHQFGPLTPGFKMVPYNDTTALEQGIGPHTVAFLVEPIQGEAGIRIPDVGYLKNCAQICRDQNILLICDEIQTGLGRTGKILACEHDGVTPDGVLLGKSLGGGLLPVSLFLGKHELMQVFKPGDHGSTFGGNPLSSAVGLEALNILSNEQLEQQAAENGAYFMKQLSAIQSPLIKEIRGKGLLIGLEVNTECVASRDVCLKLLELGLLSIDTRSTTIRLLPPLVITKMQIDEAVEIIKEALHALV